MKSLSWIATLVLAAFVLTGAPADAGAQEASTVINVFTMDANGDLPGMLEIVKRANAINARLGTGGKSRVWQATIAGQQSGNLNVGVEYPSFVAMAQAQAKQQADAEWQKLVADFNKKGMTVTSNSVYSEITP